MLRSATIILCAIFSALCSAAYAVEMPYQDDPVIIGLLGKLGDRASSVLPAVNVRAGDLKMHGMGASPAAQLCTHAYFTNKSASRLEQLTDPTYTPMWMFDVESCRWIHYRTLQGHAQLRGMGATMTYLPDLGKSLWYVAAQNVSPRLLLSCVSAIAMASGATAADEATAPVLPKAVLVGDSIRLSYTPIVAKQLSEKAIIISPEANGGDSSNVLKHLDQWVINQKPAVVHFNCGIHDTKKFKATGRYQVSPDQYAANLRKIVERIRKETGAVVLFATTTPILDDRAARTRRDRDYELLGASVAQYNAIAKKVMKELNVPINDLHSVLSSPRQPFKTQDLIGSDGVHLEPAAKEQVGKAVAAFVGAHLTLTDRRH